MITEEEILIFLIKLDLLSKEYDGKSDECSGVNLSYEHKDKFITIEYSWSTPEEGGYETYMLDLDKMKYTYQQSGSTVFGSYENENINEITSLDDFWNEKFGN